MAKKTHQKKKVEPIKSFSDEKLHKALMYVEDLMDRALLPMILWGETAHNVFNTELFGNRIQVCTYSDHFSKFSEEILQQYGNVKVKQMDNAGTCSAVLKTDCDGVPIEILAVDRKAKYVENPDTVRFRHASYLIPNPIKSYLAELVEDF